MKHDASDSGWRGSADVWLEAAQEALLETGIDGVKILPLAQRLKLSRTSFYWFFTDREALLSALVGRWREKNTGSIIGRADAYAETVTEAMLNVFDCWFDNSLFDPRFEFAIRAWAMQSESILEEVRAADHARIDALVHMLARFGQNSVNAGVRARAVYLVQIGYISMQTQESLAERLKRVSGYVTMFTGKAPDPRELDRFLARNALSAATES
jgi:AcrR family transcriptional regulator